MRVLITTIGTAGDVHPFIAIALRLLQRGHHVAIVTNPVFGPRIQHAGLTFIPSGDAADYHRVVKHPHFAHHTRSLVFAFNNLVASSVQRTVAVLQSAIDDWSPDVVLRHHINFGAQWVCDARSIPTVVAVLSPVSWLSTADPCTYGWLRLNHPPRWWAKVYKRASRLTARLIVDRRINALAKSLGFPPRRDVFFHEALGGHANLALWSRHFRPPATDDPPHGRICGFCYFDADSAQSSASDASLQAFLDAGEPPVVFTLGSSVVHNPGQFYHLAASVCQQLGRRAVLLVGPPSPDHPPPTGLPPSIAVVPYAPFSTLLPRAAAVVHHGGIGTTAQSMRAGRPTVIVPFANDEFDNARRARDLDVSRTIDAHRLTRARLLAALDAVLNTPAVTHAASALGQHLRAEDGPSAAADAIERVAVEHAGLPSIQNHKLTYATDATSAAAR